MAIPEELTKLRQWAVSINDGSKDWKKPRLPTSLALMQLNDPNQFSSYEQCEKYAYKGFILTKDDPYTVIDLDEPKTEENRQRHSKIYSKVQSYAETSQSGKGVHIICRGKIPSSVKRDDVEIYSCDRYILCTGNTCRDMPITDCQEVLDILWTEMHNPIKDAPPLMEHEEVLSDHMIVEIASNATNGDKFDMLCNGIWEEMYPSQSEADLALLSILCFYSPSNEQVRRIFRLTRLGQRAKATENDKYLDFCLRRIRASEIVAVEPEKMYEEQVAGEKQQCPQQEENPRSRPKVEPLTYPPGLVGRLAKYITETSIRPVLEVGLSAAIALCSGMAGRCYNISYTGLNQYILLLAATGTGKEGAASGIDRVISQLQTTVPAAGEYLGPAAYSSGQAIVRSIASNPSAVSVLGEFGLTIKRLSSNKANGAELTYKQVLLDLYQKSGWNSTLRSSAYSDKEKNIEMVRSPALTILGESTQESILDNITPDLIEGGLLPRFIIVEYTGDRPKRNLQPFDLMDKELYDAMCSFALTCLTMKSNMSCQTVGLYSEAQEVLDAFDQECDDEINAGNEIFKHMWNRAHLKALKLCALLAAVDNPTVPLVTKEMAQWAVDFIRRDIRIVLDRFESGDIGTSDDKRLADIRRAIQDYLGMSTKTKEGYGIHHSIAKAKEVIPFSYFRRRLRSLKAFTEHPQGVKVAISSALDDAIQTGLLAEVPKITCTQTYKCRMRLFSIG